MIATFNSKNHILVNVTKNGTIKADIKGETIDTLSNMLVSTIKSFKDLGLPKDDLLALIEYSYEND
jgi:hypothetical protein